MWFDTVFDKHLRTGTLDLTFENGRCYRYGAGQPHATWRLKDDATLRRIRADPDFMLGQTYMDRAWTTDDLRALLHVLIVNLNDHTEPSLLKRVARRLLDPIQQGNRGRASQRHVAHHYDLDESLFRAFLDEDMQYSCAYFDTAAGDDLETAQLAKKRHIAAKLNLPKEARVLDIGCGWGGMALYLAQHYQARVTGLTLAREQHRVAIERAKALGLQDRVTFLLQDYRDHEGEYDAVVSVGMFEHVGVPNYPIYFHAIERMLKPSGTALIHTIGSTGKPRPTNPWIRRYIFPGGYTPSLSEVMLAIEGTGLVTADVEVLRLHYAKTLAHWFTRFQAAREEVRRTKGEVFCRMWEFYLAAAEAGFLWRDLVVFQIQMACNNHRLPLTRDYLYADTGGSAAKQSLLTAPPLSREGHRPRKDRQAG